MVVDGLGTTMRAGIGRRLADYLLGEVRREDDRVRITARLVEAAGETNLWSETYERSRLTACRCSARSRRIARSSRWSWHRINMSAPQRQTRRLQGLSQGPLLLEQAETRGRPGDSHFQQAVASAPSFAAPMPRSHVVGLRVRSTTVSFHARRCVVRSGSRPERSSATLNCTRRTWRSPILVACSNGIGREPKSRTRRRLPATRATSAGTARILSC
jgi:hypothetical protein